MNSEWLERQFNTYPQKTKVGLARAIGLEPSAISKILRGARQIKANEYDRMLEYFGLKDGHNLSAKSLKPLIANSDALVYGQGGEKPEESWVIPSSILEQRANTAPENIAVYTIEDALMEPDFARGEHVLVDVSKKIPSPPGCYAISDGYGVFLRFCEIVPGEGSTEIRLHACSEAFSPQKVMLEHIKVLGKVVAKLQWL